MPPSQIEQINVSLAVLEQQTKTILEKVSGLETAVYGNGHPGIKTRLIKLEESHQNCIRKQNDKQADSRYIVTTIIALIIGAASVAASFLK